EWVDGPGIPSNAVIPVSDRFVKVESAIENWVAGTAAKSLPTSAWTTHEWLHFLRNLPKPMSREQMTELDGAFGFTKSGNAEVLAAWLDISIANDYAPAYDRLDSFLTTVGRRKFLVPLYARLMESKTGQVMAQNIYQR